MARDPYKYFRVEARDLLDQLSRIVLDLERGTTPELVAKLLRLAHTLKGAARVVKQSNIGDRAHAIEDTLAPLRNSDEQATKTQIDTVLHYLDEINGYLAALSLTTPASKQETITRVNSEEALRTTRIDIAEMDTLLDSLVEIHARLNGLRNCFQQAQSVRSLTTLLSTQFSTRPNHEIDFQEVKANKEQTQTILEQIMGSFDGLDRNFTASIEQLDREFKLIRDTVERMRLIPADSLFVALELAARDAAQVEKKQITFEAHGGEVRLDSQIAIALQSALSHIVRNAVVHGIEAPDMREATGKPVTGIVKISVSQRGQWIIFTCHDDGRGIDLKAIRRVAAQKNLLPDGKALENETLIQMLLKGGISTADTVTAVAGRGVGLDVVRDTVERFDGNVNLQTETGKGTTLTITVPLSIAALDGLQVESAGVTVTIPIEAVRATLRIAPNQIARTAKEESLIYEGKRIPFFPLTDVLSKAVPQPRGNRIWPVIIVEANERTVAIGVERLIGTSNIVLRPLPAMTLPSPLVAGVSVDIEGNPQLVINPVGLVAEAERSSITPLDRKESTPPILVIDDSLTTRMLERSILESAGYEVELATSGEEALEKASRHRYGLFLVDVEMPGMDGFTFIEQTHADPNLRDIPAILVTSRGSEEDLQRGKDVGAHGHIIKSQFDQGMLLARIGELVR